MSATKTALLWAGAMLAIALLAVFDVIPAEIAQYSVISLPALAWLGIMRGNRGCAPCSKSAA